MARGWTKVDYDVAMEVASHEAIIRQAYKDSVGKWTWSVGLTSATGHRVERYIGRPQSLEHCLKIYVWALENYADQVREVFKHHPLTKEQFTAALSFHWNTGAIRRASWVKAFKAGEFNLAKIRFMEWRKPPEIKTRRRRELELFFNGKWHNKGTMTEYTRLTKRSTPVWSSAKRINVEKELKAIFASPSPATEPFLDQKPQPYAMPEAPTLTPAGFWAAVAELIEALLKLLQEKPV